MSGEHANGVGQCNSSSVLGSLMGTFLPNDECEWRAWLMSRHNQSEWDPVPKKD